MMLSVHTLSFDRRHVVTDGLARTKDKGIRLVASVIYTMTTTNQAVLKRGECWWW